MSREDVNESKEERWKYKGTAGVRKVELWSNKVKESVLKDGSSPAEG